MYRAWLFRCIFFSTLYHLPPSALATNKQSHSKSQPYVCLCVCVLPFLHSLCANSLSFDSSRECTPKRTRGHLSDDSGRRQKAFGGNHHHHHCQLLHATTAASPLIAREGRERNRRSNVSHPHQHSVSSLLCCFFVLSPQM